MKIATWNINSIKVRLPQVLQWLESVQPDILALQEIKVLNENFPMAEIRHAGYEVIVSGQKSYNGVALLSKMSAQDVLTDIDNFVDEQRRILIATINDIRVINLYVPNGQSVDSEKYIYKLNWLEKVSAYIQQQLQHYPKLVVLGDFNIAPEERDVHDPLLWEGRVLFSPAERAALKKIFALGLHDSFRLFEQAEKSFSWWDYRMLGFRRNHGLRIDHILINKEIAGQCTRCYIDKEPRTWQQPSDHAPVVAEFV
jgi:exodeoxyribonuclease-3